MALRIAVEGIYWVFVCFACTSYFVGLLYAMPVTTREGIIAVYQPEVSANGSVLRPIHVILPSNTTKNIILTIGILYPSLTSFGFGVISGVLYDRGNYHASRIMMQIQYTNWVIIFWSLAVVLFYYGLKYTFILRANIIIAEAELKAPRSTFGIGNLKSRSPARFLFVQLQITGFGGSAVAIIAGGGCFAWVVAQQKILSTKSVGLPLAGAFLWTTAFTLAFFVLLGLVGAQTKRNRRRGIHQPPSGQSESEHLSQIRPKSVLKSEGTDSPYSISNSSKHSRSLSISRIEQETPTYPIQPYRTSFGTNGGGSEDNSILHTGIINEKYSMDHTQNCWTSANNGNSEVEQQRQRDFSTSVKNLSNDGELELNQPLSLLPSHSTVLSCINAAGPPSSTEICNRSAIRESVFGGRTPREETNTRTSRSSISSPPQSPISLSGFNSIRRSQSGRISAMHPRASISSITSIRSSERQNSTSSSADACGPISTTRPKDIISNPSASKKDTHSISIYVPPPQHPLATPPTPVSVREQSEAVSVPVSTNSSSSLLPKQHSQPIPRPKDRKHSIDNTRATGHNTSVSAPISVTVASSASRGAGGGYRSKSIDGPSPDSIRLYDNLLAHNQKATLFIVGSRAISFPETLKRAYNEGHHIAIHTWSHSAMTSLTNEQIVAELKWTEKAIQSVIGVTPIYWRPPYGDVDNRVRAIATQLGFKTSIWTQDFDTNDWNIPAKTATPQSVVDTFKTWLTKIPTMKTGFIVLEHDLFPEEVDVSVNGILPIAYATKNLVMQPIPQCLGDAKPYLEGAGTFKLIPDGNNSTTGGAGSNNATASNQTNKSSAMAVSGSVALTSIAGMTAAAVVALF
ncbi:chitin deacetylase [Linnemannia zychae]|nr:chitin deacetylase [Linnemannia zychae]